MEYVSPGDAFSSSLEQSLLMRQQQQRQAQMDAIAMQREQRQMRHEDEYARQAKAALEEKRAEFAEAQKDKRKSAFEKTVSSMVPGDIPTPDLLEQSKEFGLSHLFPESQPTPAPLPPPTPASVTDMPSSSDVGMAPMGTNDNPAPVPTMTGGGMRFIGTPAQRKEVSDRAQAMELIASMPEGPQRQAIETAVRMGVKPTAEMFKSQDSNDQPIARVDGKRQVVQRLVNGQWQDVTGNVPKGTHFIQEPTPAQPKDTTGRDMQRENMRTQAYNTAVTELNKSAAPFEDRLRNIEAAQDVLNERTPSGDAHVAPMVLKALVAGQGSGFRMTKAEIDQVQNARTKWQSMEASFRKWAADPKDALFFDDAQRADFGRLLETMKGVTARHLDDVAAARKDIDLAETPRDIQKRLSDLHAARATGKDDKAEKPKSAADYLADFNKKNGKK